MRHLRSSLAMALSFAATSCGPPRDKAYEFEEKRCGTLNNARTPSPPPEATTARLGGHAGRLDDDAVVVTLAPLVSVEENAVVDWSESGVTVSGNATGPLDCGLELVADAALPEAVDIVFVLDTTGSMLWAIDGVRAGIEAFLGSSRTSTSTRGSAASSSATRCARASRSATSPRSANGSST